MSIVLVATAVAGGPAFNYRDRVGDTQFAGKNVDVKFEFYSASSGGSALSSAKQTVHVASNGVFCAEVALPDRDRVTMFSPSNDLYVAVSVPSTVGAEPSVQLHGCRRKLMPVPVAMCAQDASVAEDGFVVRGNATLNRGAKFPNGGSPLHIGEDGIWTVVDVSAKTLSVSDANFTGSVSVGGDLKMTKSMTMEVPVDSKDSAKYKEMCKTGWSFTGSNVTLVAHSVTTDSLETSDGTGSLVPVGMIMMWYGNLSNVPRGWALCDGANGTPDLTGLFVVGATKSADEWNSYTLKPGGSRVVTLTETQIPKHEHEYFGDDQLVAAATKSRNHSGYDAESEKSGNSAWFRSTTAGNNVAHENRPPYMALCYIMKTK